MPMTVPQAATAMATTAFFSPFDLATAPRMRPAGPRMIGKKRKASAPRMIPAVLKPFPALCGTGNPSAVTTGRVGRTWVAVPLLAQPADPLRGRPHVEQNALSVASRVPQPSQNIELSFHRDAASAAGAIPAVLAVPDGALVPVSTGGSSA